MKTVTVNCAYFPVLLVLSWLWVGHCVNSSTEIFYPFDSDEGDTIVAVAGDDVCDGPVLLPLTVFKQRTMFVSFSNEYRYRQVLKPKRSWATRPSRYWKDHFVYSIFRCINKRLSFIYYRQDAAKRQTAGIKFTRRPKIRFFVPVWGRIASPIMHRFGRCFRCVRGPDVLCSALNMLQFRR